MRFPSFRPKAVKNHGKDCWVLNVPATVSPTKKRERRFFDTRMGADAESRRLRENFRRYGQQLPSLDLETQIAANNCLAKLVAHGVGLEAAVDAFIERKETVSESITYKELVPKVLDQKKAEGKSSKYLSDLRSKANRFLPDFGDKMVCDISPIWGIAPSRSKR